MLSDTAAAEVLEKLTARDFFRPAHQLIYEAIAALAARHAPVDMTTVFDELDRKGHLDRAGGAPYLHTLTYATPSPLAVSEYIRIVYEHSAAHQLAAAGARIQRIANDGALDLDERIAQAQKLLDDAVGAAVATETAIPVSERIYPLLDRLEGGTPDTGVTTGWRDLDALLKRCRPGQLIVVGARPRIGKSVFLANMAAHVGLTLHQPVLFASLEMPADEVILRMLAHRATVNLSHLQGHSLTEAEWDRVPPRVAELSAAEHLVIDDNPAVTVAYLRGQLATMRRKGTPAAAVFLDYIQLMTSPRRPENRQQEVAEYSRALKLLAKEFEVPIIAAAQLNRGPEQRADHRPMLADLRESGGIENDADVIVLLHREDVYDPDTPRAGEIDLIVAKHRQGPTGTVTCAFQGHYSRIADLWTPASGES